MIRKIILPTIVICALLLLTVYFYAHNNWRTLPSGIPIDRIVVEKSARKLSIFRDGKRIKRYRIALGQNPVGAKQEEGDMKTPEGTYKIDSRNAQSNFHLALHISYPSDEDTKRATAHGVSAGSDIMIHGIRNGLGWIGAFIVGRIGLRVAWRSPTKRSKKSGELRRTARQSRFVRKRGFKPAPTRATSLVERASLSLHLMAGG